MDGAQLFRWPWCQRNILECQLLVCPLMYTNVLASCQQQFQPVDFSVSFSFPVTSTAVGCVAWRGLRIESQGIKNWGVCKG